VNGPFFHTISGGKADQIIPDQLNKEGMLIQVIGFRIASGLAGQMKCPLLAVRLLNLKTTHH
jgi:hypothetical protein